MRGCGTWEKVEGTIWSVKWQVTGCSFAEHLEEFMIYFRDNSCDRKVGSFDSNGSNDKVRKLEIPLEALLGPPCDLLLLP